MMRIVLALDSDKGARSFLYRKFISAAPGGGLSDQTVKRKICMKLSSHAELQGPATVRRWAQDINRHA